MQLHVASLDLKQASDRVTPRLRYGAMVNNATHPILAMALLREQVGGRNMVGFQGITVDDAGFDRSIKQGRKDSPTRIPPIADKCEGLPSVFFSSHPLLPPLPPLSHEPFCQSPGPPSPPPKNIACPNKNLNFKARFWVTEEERRTRRPKQVLFHNRTHRNFLLFACVGTPHSDLVPYGDASLAETSQ